MSETQEIRYPAVEPAAVAPAVVPAHVAIPITTDNLPPANQLASTPQKNKSIFQGIFSALVACGCRGIVFGLIAHLFFIGVCVVLPVVMIVYGVQNNAVVCESPCVGSCGDIQRFHVLHTPPIGISVPQALIDSGVIYMVLEVVCFICCYILNTAEKTATKITNTAKLLFLMSCLALFIWSCMCINIVHSMNMQCKNYDASTGAKASVVSMEPDLLLGTSIPMLLLAFVGFFGLFCRIMITSK
jgi:hypothetical protein